MYFTPETLKRGCGPAYDTVIKKAPPPRCPLLKGQG